MFHEYVYLSDAKVRQFIPADAPWWRRMRAKKLAGAAKVAGVEASLELEPSDIARKAELLNRLVEHITLTGRWYTDRDVRAGEWVFFEGRIGYQVTGPDPQAGAVLFCEAGEPTGATPRIVLHGSARHLVTGGAAPTRTAVAPTPGGFSEFDGAKSVVEAVGRSAMSVPERTFWRLFDRSTATGDALPHHLRTLFREVAGTDSFLDAAPFLGGCARVTTVVRPPHLPFPVVLASPLYVRHERP
ncbi:MULTISPECIES: SAVMC3_10250 family protein [unclassified Saccharothrix]|uniref:SAVMC3_10250 family protein n=1 Tax=unclassified Saccharothrix TaxID=2593673 RepID=UPI00307F8981